jgi:hypothetical protein
MLGDMGAIETRLVSLGEELQPLVEDLRKRPIGTLDVIEKTDFH